jgi:peptide deformylase
MILPLVYYPDARLREKGKPVAKFDAALRKLVADMLETMEEHEGVGLAAQQVGLALQLAVIDVTGVDDRPSTMTVDGQPVNPEDYMPLFLINAKVSGTKAKTDGTEGCLSFPGLRAEISRSRRVTVKTHGLDGKPFEFEADGLLAVAVQHEHDHNQGRLFIDALPSAERAALKPELDTLTARYELMQRNADGDGA